MVFFCWRTSENAPAAHVVGYFGITLSEYAAGRGRFRCSSLFLKRRADNSTGHRAVSSVSSPPSNIRELRSQRPPDICATSDRGYNCSMAKKTTLNELGDMLAHVVKHMATKDNIADLKHELKGDIARVQEQVNSIEAQLRETKIEVRLGNLEDKVFGAPRR